MVEAESGWSVVAASPPAVPVATGSPLSANSELTWLPQVRSYSSRKTRAGHPSTVDDDRYVCLELGLDEIEATKQQRRPGTRRLDVRRTPGHRGHRSLASW